VAFHDGPKSVSAFWRRLIGPRCLTARVFPLHHPPFPRCHPPPPPPPGLLSLDQGLKASTDFYFPGIEIPRTCTYGEEKDEVDLSLTRDSSSSLRGLLYVAIYYVCLTWSLPAGWASHENKHGAGLPSCNHHELEWSLVSNGMVLCSAAVFVRLLLHMYLASQAGRYRAP
jgi:hypothetical protein